MQYRKEIDGLRAIAVMPVILFHAGIAGFSGGYIGVDIFFVISGYLITSIILDEQEKKKFSIIRFYERRARRILPALSFVLAFTTIAAYLLMPASLLKEYSQSLSSVATFSSNVFFYLKSGYFATASDEKPLLHTWSLAVEEQYYLFFPIIITLLWPLGKKWLLFCVVLTATASLILAQVLSSRAVIDANFYLIFSRAWELFFGAIVAFILLRKVNAAHWKKELLSLGGFVMIGYSVVFFNEKTPDPSFYTLLPVLGTCLIIVFTESDTYLGRALSHKTPVFVGLISYSLYLWHQPLFAFLRIKSIGEPPMYMFAMAIVGTAVFAFLSWKYVESPFRNKDRFTRPLIFQYAGASIVVFFLIGVAGHACGGFDSRFSASIYAATIESSPKRSECHTQGENYLRPDKACKFFGENITWASFGDSHTVEPAYALAKKLENDNEGLVQLSFSGCPPALLFTVKQPGCTKWINESLDYLENARNIENILVGFRYSAFLYGSQLDSYPRLPNSSPVSEFADADRQPSGQLNADEAREIYWQSLETLISRLIQAGKNVYVLYPIPELPVDVNKAIAPFSVFSNTTVLDLQQTTSRLYHLNRNKFILGKLNALPYGNKLHAVRPLEILCDETYCPTVKGNRALYFDDNHLSLSGAELVVKSILINESKSEPTPIQNTEVAGTTASSRPQLVNDHGHTPH